MTQVNPALTIIDDAVPEESISLLKEAADERGLSCQIIQAWDFDFLGTKPLQPGSMLFRPATSLVAMRVEQHLYQEGVATFYDDSRALYGSEVNPWLNYQRAGLALPRTVSALGASRERLREGVRYVGGFPLLLKSSGGSGGIGIFLIESFASLFACIDSALPYYGEMQLCSFIPEAEHHRVVVVGERAVASYLNPLETDDFRSYASETASDYTSDVPEDMAQLALAAMKLNRVSCAGVDILKHRSGRLYLLEANFPCYFPQAEKVGKIPVARAMLDELLRKAEWLRNRADKESSD